MAKDDELARAAERFEAAFGVAPKDIEKDAAAMTRMADLVGHADKMRLAQPDATSVDYDRARRGENAPQAGEPGAEPTTGATSGVTTTANVQGGDSGNR